MEYQHPEKFIAHRGDMRFIDRVAEGEDGSVLAESDIDNGHIFFDEEIGGVPSWVGIELMAQTAGAWVGMEDLRNNREITLGFLLGAREFTAKTPVLIPGTYTSCVKIILSADSTMVFSGKIKNAQGELIAHGDITAFRPDDLGAYLKGDIKW